jgi:hypothetical protein
MWFFFEIKEILRFDIGMRSEGRKIGIKRGQIEKPIPPRFPSTEMPLALRWPFQSHITLFQRNIHVRYAKCLSKAMFLGPLFPLRYKLLDLELSIRVPCCIFHKPIVHPLCLRHKGGGGVFRAFD